jgi:hypothetical protein
MGYAAPAVFGPGIRHLQPPSACFAVRHQIPSCLNAQGTADMGGGLPATRRKKRPIENDRPESF